jgi:outer membrane immunogenic protein
VKRVSVCAFLAVCLPAVASAQDLTAPSPGGMEGWFLRTRAIAGASHAAGSFSILPPGATGDDQTSYDPQENFGVGVGLGYKWNAFGVPVRAVVDGSLNFRHDTDVDAIFPGGVSNYENNLRIWDLRLSLLADVLRFGWGSFYVGAGIGAARLETEVGIENTPITMDESEWKASPSFEAGLVLDGVFERVIPEISYRFRWFGDTQSATFPTGEKLDYKDIHIHEVMLGFTIPLQSEGLRGSLPTGFTTASPMAYNWTGFHVGGYGGWAFGDIDATELVSPGGVFYNANNTYGFSDNGFVAGAQVGVDWQWKWFVLGLGADAGFLDLDNSVVDPTSPGDDTITSFSSDFHSTITARGGVAFDRLLVFAKGGVAFLNAEAETVDACTVAPCGPATVSASDDDVLFGVTAGGGLEYALTDHWSAGAEYRWVHIFDELNPAGIAAPGGAVSQIVTVNDTHTVRGSLNFRW